MVDVGGNDGAATGDLVAHELGGHPVRDGGPERLPAVLGEEERIPDLLAPEILPYRDVLHLRGDDAAPGVVHLGDVGPRAGTARPLDVLEPEGRELRVREPLAPVLGARPVEEDGVAALFDPGLASAGEPGQEIDVGVRVRVGTGGVVDREGRVVLRAEARGRVAQHHLAHPHPDVGARALDMDLARAREGAGDLVGQPGGAFDKRLRNCTHGGILSVRAPGRAWAAPGTRAGLADSARTRTGGRGRKRGRWGGSFPPPASSGSGSKGFFSVGPVPDTPSFKGHRIRIRKAMQAMDVAAEAPPGARASNLRWAHGPPCSTRARCPRLHGTTHNSLFYRCRT